MGKKNQDRRAANVVLGSSGSDQGIAAEIQGKLEEPEVQDTIMAGFRAVLDRLAPSVRTPIAMLTRDYARAGRGPDWFFRAAGRALVDATEEEYEALKQLDAPMPASSPPGLPPTAPLPRLRVAAP